MRPTARSFLTPLKSPAAIFALGGGVLGTMFSASPEPLLWAVAAQALYTVLFWLAPPIRKMAKAALPTEAPLHNTEQDALLAELSSSQREHYLSLRELREQILANYKKLPGGRVLAIASESRLDELLMAFLRLLNTLNSYRRFLGSTDRHVIESELAELSQDAAAEADSRLKEVKEKRVEILQKRIQRFQQADESRELVSHQLAEIEDLLRLTHEQSIAIRDPASISNQLEALSAEVATTEETVREMEKFMELVR